MNYKTNRVNHDFQIVYFLAGSCHTPDAAWSLLNDLRDDRVLALKTSEANELRAQAKRMRLKAQTENGNEIEQLEAMADLLEMNAFDELGARNVAAAKAELATIEKCMSALQPLRSYAHLPDAEAHEAAQAEEWRLHLAYTAQNYLLTQGTIPPDYFATMRQHPDFESSLLPMVDTMNKQIGEARSSGKLANVPLLIEKPAFSMPALLLEHSKE